MGEAPNFRHAFVLSKVLPQKKDNHIRWILSCDSYYVRVGRCKTTNCSSLFCFLSVCLTFSQPANVLLDPPRPPLHFVFLDIIKIKIQSSCEIEDFVETHLCKLCVILRSRALRVICINECATGSRTRGIAGYMVAAED